jgi:hypothetical protein
MRKILDSTRLQFSGKKPRKLSPLQFNNSVLRRLNPLQFNNSVLRRRNASLKLCRNV